jgi:N utilization substance protein B
MSVSDVLAGDYTLSDGPLDPYGEQIATGAGSMLDDLDTLIDVTSPNWSVRRMPAVDRNILRVSLYEMLEVPEVAVPVAIDEAVVLSKAYGTDETPRFVNGLLGRVATLLDEGVDVIADARERHAASEEAEEAESAAEADAEVDGATEHEAACAESAPEAGPEPAACPDAALVGEAACAEGE